mgnify:CR=1 FL=1
MRGAVQVFEYQRITVGDSLRTSCGEVVEFSKEYFEALTRYAERHRVPPFEIRHRSIVFKQYVGVIQVGKSMFGAAFFSPSSPCKDQSNSASVK